MNGEIPPSGASSDRSKGSARQRLGAWGEREAVGRLRAAGYVILDQNWRFGRFGEVDIIARDGETLVFVEVRTRRGGSFGPPEASITPRKAQRMRKVALAYLAARDLDDVAWRLDVVAVVVGRGDEVSRYDHHRNVLADWS